MRSLWIRTSAALIGAALLVACSGATGEKTATTEGELTSEPVDVPALDCTSAATFGTPDLTVRTFSSVDDARGGTAVVYRYSILDGQSYLVARASVGASLEDDGTSVSTVVRDLLGSFKLAVQDDGSATLHARTAAGYPLASNLTCVRR